MVTSYQICVKSTELDNAVLINGDFDTCSSVSTYLYDFLEKNKIMPILTADVGHDNELDSLTPFLLSFTTTPFIDGFYFYGDKDLDYFNKLISRELLEIIERYKLRKRLGDLCKIQRERFGKIYDTPDKRVYMVFLIFDFGQNYEEI